MEDVAVFEMVNVEDPSKRFSIVASPLMSKFIVFVRRTVLEATTANEQKINIYCFGYQMKGESVYHFILPDDRVVISNTRDIKLIST